MCNIASNVFFHKCKMFVSASVQSLQCQLLLRLKPAGRGHHEDTSRPRVSRAWGWPGAAGPGPGRASAARVSSRATQLGILLWPGPARLSHSVHVHQQEVTCEASRPKFRSGISLSPLIPSTEASHVAEPRREGGRAALTEQRTPGYLARPP